MYKNNEPVSQEIRRTEILYSLLEDEEFEGTFLHFFSM